MNLSPSGTGVTRDRGTPVVLRLLPHVHHPPARVALPWPGEEANALDARGYRVTVFGEAQRELAPSVERAPGSFVDAPTLGLDLVCETGGFAGLESAGRARYAEAAARVLRTGGLLFGAFPTDQAAALLTLFGARFDAARLQPSGIGGADWLEAVFVRR